MTPTQLSSGRGWLDKEAALSLGRIDAALGHAMQITEAGRTWARQNEHYQAYLAYLNGTGPWAAIALSPDAPSIHQLGNAIDTDEGQNHLDLMTEHGWIRTVYRNGVLVEPWHFEYFKNKDRHYGEEADDMFTDEDRALLKQVRDQLGGASDRKTSLRQDADKILNQVTETAQIIGSGIRRAQKGDTLGVRLDKIIAHLGGRKPLTKDD